MLCPKCGVFLLNSATVCDKCGAIIDIPKPEVEGDSNALHGTDPVGTPARNRQNTSPRQYDDAPVFQGDSQGLNRRFPDSVPTDLPNGQRIPGYGLPGQPYKPPKKGMSAFTKVFLILVAVVVGVLAVAGAMNRNKKGQTNTDSGPTPDQADNSPQNPSAPIDTTTEGSDESGEYTVKYVSHSIEKNYDGKDVLVIEYAWTNNSQKETSFTFACTDKVFQNGIECSSLAVLLDDVDTQKEFLDIKPGTTYNLKVGYILQDKTNAHVEVTDLMGKKMLMQKTIDLGGGEGTWEENSKVPAETSVRIRDSFLSKGHDGKTVLVIKYEVYNGEDHEITFSVQFVDKVFQNGVECSSFVFSDDVDATPAISSIKRGATIIVEEGYELQDMSDVEVEVKESFTDKVYVSQKLRVEK